MNVPRRSANTKRVSRKIFRWCEIVGCPIGKWRTMSQTQTADSLLASKFRIRIRIGSASALNHSAYSSARGWVSLGDCTSGQQLGLGDCTSEQQFGEAFFVSRGVVIFFKHLRYMIHRRTSIYRSRATKEGRSKYGRNFGLRSPTSVQFKGEINDALPRKPTPEAALRVLYCQQKCARL
jgi:hypothetical protein